jgi:negative regulator of flagellin synthesis FlgM
MNNVDNRAPFFPRSKSASQSQVQRSQGSMPLARNSYERAKELESNTSDHARVTIPEKIKDFSMIKRAVDSAPDVDNTDKIAMLKAQIQAGTYEPDYDAVADRLLESEY